MGLHLCTCGDCAPEAYHDICKFERALKAMEVAIEQRYGAKALSYVKLRAEELIATG